MPVFVFMFLFGMFCCYLIPAIILQSPNAPSFLGSVFVSGCLAFVYWLISLSKEKRREYRYPTLALISSFLLYLFHIPILYSDITADTKMCADTKPGQRCTYNIYGTNRLTGQRTIVNTGKIYVMTLEESLKNDPNPVAEQDFK